MILWRFFNPNPKGASAGDCPVRAIVAATGKDWSEVYLDLCLEGLEQGDWGSANSVWGAYLRKHGYERNPIPNTCPDCYTVAQFAQEHPEGTYILAISGHVVTLINGDWFDAWDSGNCVPLYYWKKEDEQK